MRLRRPRVKKEQAGIVDPTGRGTFSAAESALVCWLCRSSPWCQPTIRVVEDHEQRVNGLGGRWGGGGVLTNGIEPTPCCPYVLYQEITSCLLCPTSDNTCLHEPGIFSAPTLQLNTHRGDNLCSPVA